jgi:hypothetical protein
MLGKWIVAALSLAVALVAYDREAHAVWNYRACVRLGIQTTDSGDPSVPGRNIAAGPNAGGTEDHWTTCDNGCNAMARGIRVRVSQGAWNEKFWADPATGCFDFSRPTNTTNNVFTLRVYSKAQDAAGNVLRVHDSPMTVGTFPGTVFSAVLANVPLLKSSGAPQPTYLTVNDNLNVWTATAAAAFTLYRYHDGIANKEFHIGLDTTSCGGSSSMNGQLATEITQGRQHIKLGSCAVGNPQSRAKFIVAHEIGHGLGRFRANANGNAPWDLGNATTPNACGFGGSYSLTTKEFNSVGFKEGHAHFVAARVFNNKESEGAFSLQGNYEDLERWGGGSGAASGGRLKNECCVSSPAQSCASSWANAGTNEDWLRFYWDVYTNVHPDCGTRPGKATMLDLFAVTRNRASLGTTNAWCELRAAAATLNQLPQCLRLCRLAEYGTHNGVDTSACNNPDPGFDCSDF